MRNGAGVHVKDRNNDSPLMCAINGKQKTNILSSIHSFTNSEFWSPSSKSQFLNFSVLTKNNQTKHATGSKICEYFGIWNFKKLWGEPLNYENLYSKIIQFNSLILGEQKETIRALRTCGAHLQMGPLELGEKLCSFARLGDRKKLKCFKLAGTQNFANRLFFRFT